MKTIRARSAEPPTAHQDRHDRDAQATGRRAYKKTPTLNMNALTEASGPGTVSVFNDP